MSWWWSKYKQTAKFKTAKCKTAKPNEGNPQKIICLKQALILDFTFCGFPVLRFYI